MNIFGAYIEDYQYIKLIIPLDASFNPNHLYLVGNKKKYNLKVFKQETFANELHVHTNFSGSISLHIDYHVDIDGIFCYPLSLGKITRSPRFDFEFYYDGPLGYDYQYDQTTFRCWSPVAKEVILVLVDPNGNETKTHMQYRYKGVWETTIQGDLERYGYYYLVRVNQLTVKVLDPYARSSNANSRMNYIIDWKKTYQNKAPRPNFSGIYTDAIIYEMHLRDFSVSRFQNRLGRRNYYLEAIENSDGKTGIDYLQSLGITHVQLQPLNVFGGVDEENQDQLYNWGYNPVEYNVPSGWYSSDPNDPYARINEIKQMVDGFHNAGLLVNLDVVYNHVYETERFSWTHLVPGYTYRYDQRGFMTNSSGCGNDIATERKMNHRFILNSVLFWAKEYQMDGFRFDLMGLMDASLMNEIVKEVKRINPQAIIYGEGWKMPTNLLPHEEANMFNYWHLPDIAFFNDRFRNFIKGDPFKNLKGFAMGEKIARLPIEMLIQGSAKDEYVFLSPNQSINYVECHDNSTFFDQLIKLNKNLTQEEQISFVRLSLGLVLLSAGIPFIHSGEEFLRTKHGVENSYRSPDAINHLDWERKKAFEEVTETLKDLITLRKKYRVFRLSDISEIEKSYRFDRQNRILSYRIRFGETELQVIIKNNFEPEIFYFAPGVELLFDGKRLVNQVIDSLSLTTPGVYVLSRSYELKQN